MLQYQIQIFPFRGGVDEGTDPKQLAPGTLKTLRNYVWLKSGLIQKRYGCVKYGSSAISNCKRLIVRNQELLATDGVSLYGLSATNSTSRGAVATEELNVKTLTDTANGVGFADQVRLSNGNVVYAWIEGINSQPGTGFGIDGFNLSYRIVDAQGTEVQSAVVVESVSSVWSCRLVTNGTDWMLAYIAGTATTSNSVVVYSSTSGTVNTPFNDSASKALDATYNGTNAVFVYAVAAGMKVFTYSFSGSSPITSATVDAASTAYKCAAVAIVGTTAMIAGNNSGGSGSDIRVTVVNPSTLAVTAGPSSIATNTTNNSRSCTVSLLPTSTTQALLGWSEDYALLGEVTFRRVTTGAVATGGYCYASQVRPVSKPWFDLDGSIRCLIATNSAAFGAPNGTTINPSDNIDETMVMDVTPPVAGTTTIAPLIIAKVDTLIGSFWRAYCLTQSITTPTSVQLLAPFVSSFDGYATRNGFRQVTITSPSADPWRSVQLGPETIVFGSVVHAYDGDWTFPYSFSYSPTIDVKSTVNSTTGGTFPAGTYTFAISAERRSAAGVLHRGPPSIPRSFTTTGATSSFNLKWGPIWDSPAARPESNDAELFPVFYIPTGSSLLTRAVSSAIFVLNGKADRANPEKSTGVITNLSNLSGPVAAVLYTQSGELEDVQPPGMTTGCIYRNRIYAVDNTGLAVWFTKRVDQNPGIAPGWNPANRLLFDKPVTGLAVLDDRLIIFTASGIFIYASDGPELTGDYIGGASLPNKLQTDVGCTNPRSIVSGMDGVYFQCNSDIQMLSRKLTVEWVGKPVQDQLGNSPTVTSAVLVEQMNHIRFTLASGVTLVWDYVESQWAVFTYLNGTPIVDAIMHAGAYTFVTGTGQVYKETIGVYLDDGAYVSSQFETVEISAAGPVAYHNVRKVQFDGTSNADHTLTVDVAFNGETSWSQTVVFASGVNNATAPGPIEAVSVSMGTRRKLRTVRYRVTDTAPTVLTTGQGPAWSTMGIEFGVNKGFGRLPARERM